MATSTAAPMLAPAPPADWEEAVQRACARIAPTWPLDRFIAVNPLWGFTDAPFEEAAARLAALSGSRLLMPRAWYREQWRAGRFTAAHLREALAQAGSPRTVAHLEALLEMPEPQAPRRARMTDVADAGRDLVHAPSWGDFVVHSLSQFCAAWFDEGQAQLGPPRAGGLYASWRAQAALERGPALLMGLEGHRERVQALPEEARALIPRALEALGVTPAEHEGYLTALLLDLNGWAAWCAYRRWTARLAGGDDGALVELLALRLAWEWLLLQAGGPGRARAWQRARASWPAIDGAARAAQAEDWLLQRALELAYQEPLCRMLPRGFGASAPEAPEVQAAFCIDVRSEVLRRALEVQSPAVQTLGFAGFFGLPLEYQPLGSTAACPQLPGLLAPRLLATDVGAPVEQGERRARRLALGAVWKKFKTGASSGFSYVEALGPLYLGKLLSDSLGLSRPVPHPQRAGLSASAHANRRPRLSAVAGGAALTEAARVDLAAGVLRAMSLTRTFAPLVALVGHGSQSVNNPHAAGLDCGACGGQSGEVNARALAALLNTHEVREGLAGRGLVIPAGTHFVAGLHDTTTDVVTLFDVDLVPPSHTAHVERLRTRLLEAGALARAERARALGLAEQAERGDAAMQRALQERARDWAQVRPEWGLANNAALIIAPREHCRHLDLAGRAFLHEYRWQEDADFSTLELLMTAPLVVAHWINLQYYASTVDNVRYGSGNKVLHNVVGGHLGVFEGNGGDLRIGLSLQSLHDGERWVHTPLRLSVFLEAPRPAIEAVLRKHAQVRALVDHGWLHLFQLDADERAVHAYRQGGWAPTAG